MAGCDLGSFRAHLAVFPIETEVKYHKIMRIQLSPVIGSLVGLLAGAIIGVSFGAVQEAALRRHRKRQQAGQLNSGWQVMPGSVRRVAYLLAALALVQVTFPLLFGTGYQWWISGGVLAGYGTVLFLQLRQRLSQTH